MPWVVGGNPALAEGIGRLGDRLGVQEVCLVIGNPHFGESRVMRQVVVRDMPVS